MMQENSKKHCKCISFWWGKISVNEGLNSLRLFRPYGGYVATLALTAILYTVLTLTWTYSFYSLDNPLFRHKLLPSLENPVNISVRLWVYLVIKILLHLLHLCITDQVSLFFIRQECLSSTKPTKTRGMLWISIVLAIIFNLCMHCQITFGYKPPVIFYETSLLYPSYQKYYLEKP